MKMKLEAEIWHILHLQGVDENLFYFFGYNYYIFFFVFLMAVISCQQLSAADENEMLPRELKLSTYISFRMKLKMSLNFIATAVISCQQLLTADDS